VAAIVVELGRHGVIMRIVKRGATGRASVCGEHSGGLSVGVAPTCLPSCLIASLGL